MQPIWAFFLGCQEKHMSNVIVYIDGFNLYHAIADLGIHKLKWINLWKLSETFLRRNESLVSVNFYTAVLNWNHEKQKRHQNYIKAQKCYNVTVHEAKFKRARRVCFETGRNCKFYEEKQTDVAIAVSLVSDALLGNFSRAILVTADSDQIPAAKFVRALGFEVSLFYPPNRASLARELGQIVTNRSEITSGRLGTCIMPQSVKDASGRPVAFMPSLYQQD
jgi:uncharacterized LabA/DUF88 family protein